MKIEFLDDIPLQAEYSAAVVRIGKYGVNPVLATMSESRVTAARKWNELVKAGDGSKILRPFGKEKPVAVEDCELIGYITFQPNPVRFQFPDGTELEDKPLIDFEEDPEWYLRLEARDDEEDY